MIDFREGEGARAAVKGWGAGGKKKKKSRRPFSHTISHLASFSYCDLLRLSYMIGCCLFSFASGGWKSHVSRVTCLSLSLSLTLSLSTALPE
jgi:hypothetical protein